MALKKHRIFYPLIITLLHLALINCILELPKRARINKTKFGAPLPISLYGRNQNNITKMFQQNIRINLDPVMLSIQVKQRDPKLINKLPDTFPDNKIQTTKGSGRIKFSRKSRNKSNFGPFEIPAIDTSDQSFNVMNDNTDSSQIMAFLSNQQKDLSLIKDEMKVIVRPSDSHKSFNKEMAGNLNDDRSLIQTLGDEKSFVKTNDLLTQEDKIKSETPVVDSNQKSIGKSYKLEANQQNGKRDELKPQTTTIGSDSQLRYAINSGNQNSYQMINSLYQGQVKPDHLDSDRSHDKQIHSRFKREIEESSTEENDPDDLEDSDLTSDIEPTVVTVDNILQEPSEEQDEDEDEDSENLSDSSNNSTDILPKESLSESDKKVLQQKPKQSLDSKPKPISNDTRVMTDVIPIQSVTASLSSELKTLNKSLISESSIRQHSTQTIDTPITEPIILNEKELLEEVLELSETPISSQEESYFHVINESQDQQQNLTNSSDHEHLFRIKQNLTVDINHKSKTQNKSNEDKKMVNVSTLNKEASALDKPIVVDNQGFQNDSDAFDAQLFDESISQSIDPILPEKLSNKETSNRSVPFHSDEAHGPHLDVNPKILFNAKLNKSVEKIKADTLKSDKPGIDQNRDNFNTKKQIENISESEAMTQFEAVSETSTNSPFNSKTQFIDSVSTTESTIQKSYQSFRFDRKLNFNSKKMSNKDQKQISKSSSMIQSNGAKNNIDINNGIDSKNNSNSLNSQLKEKNSIIGDKSDTNINKNENTVHNSESINSFHNRPKQESFSTEVNKRIDDNLLTNPKISKNFYQTLSRMGMYENVRQLLEKAKCEAEQDNHNYDKIKNIYGKIDANKIRENFETILDSPELKRAIELSKLPNAAEEYTVDEDLVNSLLDQLNQINELNEEKIVLSSTSKPLSYVLGKHFENKTQIKANETEINSSVNLNTNTEKEELKKVWSVERLWTTETIETQKQYNESKANKQMMKENLPENRRTQNNYNLFGTETPIEAINPTKTVKSVEISIHSQTLGSSQGTTQTISPVISISSLTSKDSNQEFTDLNKNFAIDQLINKIETMVTFENTFENMSKLIEEKGILPLITPSVAQIKPTIAPILSNSDYYKKSNIEDYRLETKYITNEVLVTTTRTPSMVTTTTSQPMPLINNISNNLNEKPNKINQLLPINQYLEQNNRIQSSLGVVSPIESTKPPRYYDQGYGSQNDDSFGERINTRETFIYTTKPPRSILLEYEDLDENNQANLASLRTTTLFSPLRNDQSSVNNQNIDFSQTKNNLKPRPLVEKQTEDTNKVSISQYFNQEYVTTENFLNTFFPETIGNDSYDKNIQFSPVKKHKSRNFFNEDLDSGLEWNQRIISEPKASEPFSLGHLKKNYNSIPTEQTSGTIPLTEQPDIFSEFRNRFESSSKDSWRRFSQKSNSVQVIPKQFINERSPSKEYATNQRDNYYSKQMKSIDSNSQDNLQNLKPILNNFEAMKSNEKSQYSTETPLNKNFKHSNSEQSSSPSPGLRAVTFIPKNQMRRTNRKFDYEDEDHSDYESKTAPIMPPLTVMRAPEIPFHSTNDRQTNRFNQNLAKQTNSPGMNLSSSTEYAPGPTSNSNQPLKENNIVLPVIPNLTQNHKQELNRFSKYSNTGQNSKTTEAPKNDDRDDTDIKSIADQLSEMARTMKNDPDQKSKENIGVALNPKKKRITRMRVKVYDIEFDDGSNVQIPAV